MNEVFVIQNISTNNVELIDFGLIIPPNYTIDLGNFDESLLSNQLNNYLVSGAIVRLINNVSVAYNQAFTTETQVYNLDSSATNASINQLYNQDVTINASLGFFATNASVGLALRPYATNASVGLAIAPLATNASVGLALQPYTTNASIGLAAFAKNASLSLYVPYTGATQDLSLGNNHIRSVDGISLNTNPTYAKQQGQLYWDGSALTLAVDINSDVTLQVGQEQLMQVYNGTGSTILNGQVVYITGTYSPDIPIVALAKADNVNTAHAVGIATQDIIASNTGFVTLGGIIHDLNTLGYTAGDFLYLSDTVAGAFTSTPVQSPSIWVRVGKVLNVSATTGSVIANLQIGRALTTLTDVGVINPAVDDRLIWNGLRWINTPGGTVSAGAGVTFFLSEISSNISAYESLWKSPQDGSEYQDYKVINSSTHSILGNYLSEPSTGLKLNQIDGGIWTFNTYASVSNTSGITQIKTNVYKRNYLGVETSLFTVVSADINSTTVVLYTTPTVQPSFVLDPSDRILMRYEAWTDSSIDVSLNFYHGGTTHYTNISSPLVTRHNDLAGIQGGFAEERFHLNQAQLTVVQNTSNVNTGDQDLSGYATTAALYPYATNASVGLALQPYATNSSINTAAFAKNASLGLYATNASVGLAIALFATNASVGLAVAPFATNSSVGLAIAPFASNSSVGLAIAPFATNASVGIALQPFATNSSINTAAFAKNASLGLYATNASVGLAIAPFATNASVGLAFQPYATNSSVNAAFVTTNASFGTYATNSSVGLAIAPFATNASVGLSLQPYATNASVNAAFITTNASFGAYATNASIGLALQPYATNASVGLAIAPFATNSSVGLAIAPFATNSSVGLAIAPFATNASVGIALQPYATNSSVNAAFVSTNASFGAYATNASVGLALGPYATNASVGLAEAAFATNASINTAAFAKNSSLSLYATNASISLAGFTTDLSVNSALGAYATNSSINTAAFAKNASLGLYATNSSVGLAIAPFATNASVGLALGAYATNASIGLAGFVTSSSLNNYATNASVGLAIAPFATNASVGLAIAPFATNASVGLALAPFATNVSVGLALGTYATNASVGLAIAPFATNASVGLALGSYATTFYVNGSLNKRDLSINELYQLENLKTTNASANLAFASRDASIGILFSYNLIQDSSILGKVSKSGDTMTGDLTLNSSLFVNGNIIFPLGNNKLSSSTGLILEQIGDTYGATRLYIQNRNGVNGAMFEQAGSVDLIDFVFKSLTQQRNIRLENRTISPYGTLALPVFKIGGVAPDNATLYIADNGGALMNGNFGVNTLSPAFTFDVNGNLRITGYSIFGDVSVSGKISGPYLDGSLATRDSSITSLFSYNLVQDNSIILKANNASFGLYATNASIALASFATNASVGLAIAPFATNASVGLALGSYATNASIALASFATNASVGLAIAPFATNASVGLALGSYATNASSNLAFSNRDASLIAIRIVNGIQDASIGSLTNYQASQDASILARVRKTGDIMTGDLFFDPSTVQSYIHIGINSSTGSLELLGGRNEADGAYFHITGSGYTGSPYRGSAEFVIRDLTESQFSLFSYDGNTTWINRFNVSGSTGLVQAYADVSIGRNLIVNGWADFNSSLGVLGDVSIVGSLRVTNCSSTYQNSPYLAIDISNGNKIINTGDYYGQDYHSYQNIPGSNHTLVTANYHSDGSINNQQFDGGTYKITVSEEINRSVTTGDYLQRIMVDGVILGNISSNRVLNAANFNQVTKVLTTTLTRGAHTIDLQTSQGNAGTLTFRDVFIEAVRVL